MYARLYPNSYENVSKAQSVLANDPQESVPEIALKKSINFEEELIYCSQIHNMAKQTKEL